MKGKNKNWDLIGFVISSDYRKKLLFTLKERPKTPKELSKETKLCFSHVSITLKKLSEKNLVKCLNPIMKKGRVYSITDKGDKILESLKKT